MHIHKSGKSILKIVILTKYSLVANKETTIPMSPQLELITSGTEPYLH